MNNNVYQEPEFNIVCNLTDDVITTSTFFETNNGFNQSLASKPLGWRSSRVEI